MTRRVLCTVVALCFVFAVAAPLLAADTAEKGKPQTICPVMGGKIDKKVYADYQGKRVYFCCTSCREEFKKDPEKYHQEARGPGSCHREGPGREMIGTGMTQACADSFLTWKYHRQIS